VYSSAGSGVVDLGNNYGTSYPEPDDIWFAEWNGNRTTDTSYIPPSDWAGHHRLHQYVGDHNETYGGATLDIDGDAVDGDTASAGGGGQFPDGTFIQLTSTGQIFRIAGGAPLYVNDPTTVGSPQSYTQVTQQQYDALVGLPLDGTFLETSSGAEYRVAGGYPFAISNPALFGGAAPVLIDPWDVDNLGDPLAHLSSAPAGDAGAPGSAMLRLLAPDRCGRIDPSTGHEAIRRAAPDTLLYHRPPTVPQATWIMRVRQEIVMDDQQG